MARARCAWDRWAIGHLRTGKVQTKGGPSSRNNPPAREIRGGPSDTTGSADGKKSKRGILLGTERSRCSHKIQQAQQEQGPPPQFSRPARHKSIPRPKTKSKRERTDSKINVPHRLGASRGNRWVALVRGTRTSSILLARFDRESVRCHLPTQSAGRGRRCRMSPRSNWPGGYPSNRQGRGHPAAAAGTGPPA